MREAVTATAPGKVILLGEHAVVYGRPAIALPVHQVWATATVAPALHHPDGAGRDLTLVAADLGTVTPLAGAAAADPLARIVRLTLAHLGAPVPAATLSVRSTIPVASGMGSGAAVSAATARALAAFMGHELPPETLSALVYEVEKLHHGAPSGIDNTVVVYELPVYFVRGAPPQTFQVNLPLHLVIGDTGIASPTRVAVGQVRRAWEQDPARYEDLFDQVGAGVQRARTLIESGGDRAELGALMDRNHDLLREMGVSSPALERLTAAARAAGALGAKLSGAGRGGNMIALVEPASAATVAEALRQAGAVSVIQTSASHETR
jgi:mevalonate kinase